MKAVADPASLMIIDDEPDNLTVLEALLCQEGWNVRAFRRGESALAAAWVEPPDLVLLDICMPDLDGYGVCRRFKADATLRPIPILFLSALSDTKDLAAGFACGGVDYIAKPFRAPELLARVRTHLQLRRHQLQMEELVGQRVTELAEAHRRLRIWDEAKTQWLSVLSHEMRTPLTGIFGVAELLFLDAPPGSDGLCLRPEYEQSRDRIVKLMDDALTLINIDVAAERFVLRPTPLRPVLQCALDALSGQVPTLAVCAALDEVADVTIWGPSELLTRAFTDLLLTAARCTGEGATLTLETHFSAGEANVALGTGGTTLPPAALETFFDVGGQRILHKGSGDFGLGAALSSRIIRLCKGRVAVHNDAAAGLVLTITLPAEHGATRPTEGAAR